MGYKWKPFSIARFYGLDLKTNTTDVLNGKSLDLDNVYTDSAGVVSKRPGGELMFSSDETGSTAVNGIGTCTLSGTKYYFKFAGGKFRYSTTLSGDWTSVDPSPAISSTNLIWWAVLDNKLFFADGVNVLRYFNGTAITASTIYERPTIAALTSSGGTGFDYTYTVDNGNGESPACSVLLADKTESATIIIKENFGPASLVIGDVIRIYSKATSIAAASKLVATHTWDAVDDAANQASIATVAISDTQPQLYTELGLAVNLTAPTALTGIVKHYGRLVGWKESTVYNSKSTNPHSWPSDSAQKNAFVYTFGDGDGETISVCASYRETLAVMKPSNIAIFGGVGPDDTGGNAYSFRRLETNGKGCIAPKSVATSGEEGQTVLVYLSRSGFMATDGNDPLAVGEEIQTQFRTTAASTLALSYAAYDSQKGIYCCAVGPAGSKTIYVLDVRKDLIAGEPVLFGWFKWSGIQANVLYFDQDRMLFGTNTGLCISQRIAGTSSDFRDPLQEYVAAASIDTATDIITVAHSYATGDIVVIRTTGTVPAGLAVNTTYFVIRLSATTIKLATTLANALAGTAVDITTQGVGTHSLVGSQAISAYYTTNWIHFDNPLLVKKLAKPGIVFNAVASSVNLTVSTAYNWVNTFQHAKVVVGGANDPWGSEPFGSTVWGGGSVAKPLNYGLPRRKVRSIRFKFSNAVIDQDFALQAINLPYDYLRNRGNFAA